MPYYSLEHVTIAMPCNASWEGMTGDNYVRFCGGCKKNVFNLSKLTRSEAEHLLEQHEGKLCTRFYKRTDGTILTADCPKELKQLRNTLRQTRIRALARVLPVLGLLGISLPSFGSYRDPKIMIVPQTIPLENQSFMGDTVIVTEVDLVRVSKKHPKKHKSTKSKQVSTSQHTNSHH